MDHFHILTFLTQFNLKALSLLHFMLPSMLLHFSYSEFFIYIIQLHLFLISSISSNTNYLFYYPYSLQSLPNALLQYDQWLKEVSHLHLLSKVHVISQVQVHYNIFHGIIHLYDVVHELKYNSIFLEYRLQLLIIIFYLLPIPISLSLNQVQVSSNIYVNTTILFFHLNNWLLIPNSSTHKAEE
jgi:hypothetical protein